MNEWQNPLLTLGERSVAFAENELKNGVKEDKPGSYTSARIREYFSLCTRKIYGAEVTLNFTKGNWCAASASFCMMKSLLPGEKAPHGCRLGVVEIVSDLQSQGLWRPVSDVLNGSYIIQVGDLIVFDRSQPNKPETSWWRHVGRVYDISQSGFECISGNSGGCWRISNHKLSQSTLLGFGQYPSAKSTVIGFPTEGIDWSNIDLDDLAPPYDSGNNLSSDNFFSIYKDFFKK